MRVSAFCHSPRALNQQNTLKLPGKSDLYATLLHRLRAARPRNLLRVTYDRAYWEQLWAKTLREHPDKVAQRPPNAHLIAEVAGLRPGRSLDAGCGHGAETLWLAAHGWEVTAVDFSASALAHARSRAEALGRDIAERIEWVEGDLAVWTPPRNHFDLVVCLCVHVAGSVDEMVRRMARGSRAAGKRSQACWHSARASVGNLHNSLHSAQCP